MIEKKKILLKEIVSSFVKGYTPITTFFPCGEKTNRLAERSNKFFKKLQIIRESYENEIQQVNSSFYEHFITKK